jgi:hypothetical protein
VSAHITPSIIRKKKKKFPQEKAFIIFVVVGVIQNDINICIKPGNEKKENV